MWKYVGVLECNTFLLSLHLLDNKSDKDYLKTLYSISNNIQSNYRVYQIKKKSGKKRTIHEPSYLLKHIQRQILKNILENKRISDFAKAYKKGCSLLDNCACHVQQNIILKLDIQDFFDNISFLMVYENCFPIEYFPQPVGILLTHLCCYNDHLIQGAPTSSYISNLVLRDFDEEIGHFCQEHNICYTRYSDDMTFSGQFNPSEVITLVRQLLKKIGLSLNNQKIHVIGRFNCQYITGVVVNEKLNVKRSYRRKIRQEMYYLKKYQDDYFTFNHLDKKPYLDSLLGKINYVLSISKANQEFLAYKEIVLTFLVK